MSRSINRVTLFGRLTKDPVTKYTPSGAAVSNFSLALNEKYKSKTGEWVEKTEYVDVVLWQKLAELAGEYLHKGDPCFIEGKLATRSWDDKTSGQKRYKTEVIGSELILLGNGGASHNPSTSVQPEPAMAGADDSESPF